ncbi:MAG: Cof-type HAD-IIB family hydrolase [Erysipelotrichaceae bacterium]
MEKINIKAIFFDIDGTTYDHYNHEISLSTQIALTELKRIGYKVCFVTGRNIYEMKNLPPFFFNFDYDALISDGGSIIRIDGEIVDELPVSNADIKAVIEYCSIHNISLRYTFKDTVYFMPNVEQYVKDIFFKLYLFSPTVRNYTGGDIYNLLAYTHTRKEKADIAKLLNNNSFLDLQDCLEILNTKAGKHLGIEMVLKRWNLSMNDCFAFGDGYNDIPMLTSVGYGVAMGNANEDLKACAWKVCLPINEDGIYKILKEYHII